MSYEVIISVTIASGVEMKFKNMKYPVMIAPTHIPELVDITHTDLGIRFGASVTLSRIDKELKEAVEKYPGMKSVFMCKPNISSIKGAGLQI